jgi:hypothetical protein
MRMKEFKDALLVAMLRHQKQVGYSSYFEPRDAAKAAGLSYEAGQIRLCLNDFDERGLVRAAFTMGGGPDGGLGSMLTAAGVEAAEEAEIRIPDLAQLARYLPQPGEHGEPLRKKVTELRELVAENRDNDFPEKEGCLAEILALELLLGQPQISVPLVEKILAETVTFLAHKFAEKAIGMVAGAVIALAATLLGMKIVP